MVDFVPFFAGPPAPVATLLGSFTVTFDPSVAVYNVVNGLTVHSLNLPVGGQFAFSYTPNGELTLGAILTPWDSVGGEAFQTDDFYMGFFQPLDVAPNGPNAGYTRAGIDDFWSSVTGSVSATDGVASVPEPSAWVLLLLGFVGVGAGLRNRRLAVRSRAA